MSFLLIFLASVAGSPHCVAMCGGFSAVAAQGARSKTQQALYHLGRLLTYLTLGVVAGMIGEGLQRRGEILGIGNFAALLSGAILLTFGIVSLLHQTHKFVPHRFFRVLLKFHQSFATFAKTNLLAYFLLGASSTLLPCGWLYTYITVAAATSSPSLGMLTMLFFWLGTMPLLLSFGSLSRLLSTPLRRTLPFVTSLLIIAAGFYSLFSHIGIPRQDNSSENVSGMSHCHHSSESH